MKYIKKILSLLLVLALCAGFMIPVSATGPVPTYEPSDGLIQAIRIYEGFSSKRYWDVNHYSIGYGCSFETAKLLFPKDVPDDEYTLTMDEAVELLIYSARSHTTELNNWLTWNNITVNQNQFDALLDLTLNVGVGWLYYVDPDDGGPCRLVRLLKKGSAYWTEDAVSDAFGTWVYAGGERLPGLVARRAYDAELFMTPVNAQTPMPDSGETIDPDDGTTPDDGTVLDDGGNSEDTPPEEVTGYLDVPENSWYYDYVYEATELGLMKGIGNNLFEPEREVTRAEVVQAMANFARADLSGYNSTSFSDVFLSDWYAPAVAWASENEYVNGMGQGQFMPGNTIIREHLCNIFARYLQREGFVKTQEVELFTDDAMISESGRENVYFCVAMGVVNGMGDGTFSPNTGATRAQLAKLLVEMYGIVYAAG